MLLKVNLWGELLGALDYRERTGQTYFEFNPEFDLDTCNVAPILMPAGAAAGTVYGPYHAESHPGYDGLPPMLADALPDHFGNEVLRKWLHETARSWSDFHVGKRLSYVGARGMGALEFEPGMMDDAPEDDQLEVAKLAELSNQIASKGDFPEQEQTNVLQKWADSAVSAGGARPKATISINMKDGRVIQSNRHREGFTPVIIKFDEPSTQNPEEGSGRGQVEYIYHRMATEAGIDMTRSGLIKRDGLRHFITQRFDRTATGEKLHAQTLAAIAGLPHHLVHDYEEAFKVLNALGLPYSALVQQFTRMVFNLLSSNTDCHTKNIGFLMNREGQWSLAPAYDLTFPRTIRKGWGAPQAMSINGKREGIELHDVLEVAKRHGIKRPKAIIERVETALRLWPTLADRYKLNQHASTIIPTHFQRLLF